MNKKTEYYVKQVKLLTKQRSKLEKEREEIKSGFMKESKDDSWGSVWVDMYEAVNDDRNKKISEIDEKLNKINIELFIIENAALRRATKLSPSAKYNGFITNDAYANYKLEKMMEEYGKEEIDRYLNSSHWLETIPPLGLHEVLLDARNEMTEKEANKISRR